MLFRALLVVSLVAGCAGTPLPASIMAGMTQGCLQSPNADKCDCLMAEAQKRLSLEDYREYEAALATGRPLPEKFAKAISESRSACLNK